MKNKKESLAEKINELNELIHLARFSGQDCSQLRKELTALILELSDIEQDKEFEEFEDD